MKKQFLVVVFAFVTLMGCKDEVDDVIDPEDEVELEDEEIEEIDIDTPDWTETTHSNDVAPDYATVFPDDQVLRIDLTISESNWALMQSDLDENLAGTSVSGIDFTPVWVNSTVTFNDTDWYQVGIRYKGNSSLSNAYRSNTDKYPFKLDFDEFEDQYPDIKNQRFYGFKQLNLSNNYDDDSFMRERVSSDLFRAFGVASAEASFCAVYLDRGNGSEFLGIYTLVEEVDDTLYETQFTDDEGNLYKPDGDAASFAQGTYDEDEMDLKTNEDEADYSDVLSLYNLMHSDTRTSDNVAWQNELEAIFDVDRYLKYLAVNTVIQNWDTYGLMTHNYFLYNDQGKLVWIPWDNNEAFQDGKMGGALSLSLSEVGSDWPLISYVIAVDSYEEKYQTYVRQFTDEQFTTTAMSATFASYETLLSDYAALEGSNFSSAINELNSHVSSRNTAVDNYLR